MPLIYGEGLKAFLRLQEEIVKRSDDQTILCWSWDPTLVPDNWQSIMAPCPGVFADSGVFVSTPDTHNDDILSYTITNAGLRIRLPLVTGLHCTCAMLDVITTEEMDSRNRRRVCIPLVEEQRIYRRCPFPSRPILLHALMSFDTRAIYLLARGTRNLAGLPGLMPLRQLTMFDLGFYITFVNPADVSSIGGDGISLSIEYYNPRGLPAIFKSNAKSAQKPIYSAIGLPDATKRAFNFLVMTVKRIDSGGGRGPVGRTLDGPRDGPARRWHCEIVDNKDYPLGGEEWRRLLDGEGPRPERSISVSPSMMVVLDKEFRDLGGAIYKNGVLSIPRPRRRLMPGWQDITQGIWIKSD